MPASVKLDTHLDTAIYFFRAALIVDPELEDVAVPEREGTGLAAGGAETDVVEEGAAGALSVPDEEGARLVGEDVGMPPGDHFGFECDA